MVICMTLPRYFSLLVGCAEAEQQSHCQGLVMPSCFLPFTDASLQPWARARPRLKEDTHTCLFILFPRRKCWSQFMQITMQISSVDFIAVSCQNVDAELYFIINAQRQEDFNKCRREHLLARRSAVPVEVLSRGMYVTHHRLNPC